MNHALGVLSFEVMDAFQGAYAPLWRSAPGTLLLYGSVAVHFMLTLAVLYRRTTLRMPAWEAVQIVMGLIVIPLLAIHAGSMRAHREVFGFSMTYESAVTGITTQGWAVVAQFVVMIVVVWVHLAVGVHFWLRPRPGYRRWLPVVRPTVVVIVVLGVVGFLRAVWSVVTVADPVAYRERVLGYALAQADAYQPVATRNVAIPFLLWLGATVLVLVARAVRARARRRRGVFRVTVPGGRTISAPVGTTVLEALRAARIPHASVCGGRGRCTTCRVSVRDPDELPPPEETERRGLARIHAATDVRLACQLRPARDLDIVPLLAADATARDANRPGGVQGREQPVVIMFVDLRESTRLGEERLPYDVLFILNQFFAEMAAALTETGGHYAQFSGDGLMALYGVDESLATGARNALRGARVMHARLGQLNHSLRDELRAPLRMGVGIHCGEAIVGTMGPPSAPNFTAIGDNVNIAARLEALTKERGCAVIISASVARSSGLDFGGLTTQDVQVRGRDEPVAVYAIGDPARIPTESAPPGAATG